MKIDEVAAMRGMEAAYVTSNQRFLDLALSGAVEVRPELKLKRLQFDVYPDVFDEVERMASLLTLTKREFCETAVVDALHRAKEAFFGSYRAVTGQEYEIPAVEGDLEEGAPC